MSISEVKLRIDRAEKDTFEPQVGPFIWKWLAFQCTCDPITFVLTKFTGFCSGFTRVFMGMCLKSVDYISIFKQLMYFYHNMMMSKWKMKRLSVSSLGLEGEMVIPFNNPVEKSTTNSPISPVLIPDFITGGRRIRLPNRLSCETQVYFLLIVRNHMI